MCLLVMVLFFVLYEVGFVLLYGWTRTNSPEMSVWVMMGSKAFKIVAAGFMLVFVKFLTDEPLLRFGMALLAVLLLSVVVESAYCLMKSKR